MWRSFISRLLAVTTLLATSATGRKFLQACELSKRIKMRVAGQQDECRRLVQERLELMRRSGSGRAAHQSLGVLELGLGNAEAAVPLLSAILDEQTGSTILDDLA